MIQGQIRQDVTLQMNLNCDIFTRVEIRVDLTEAQVISIQIVNV